MASRLGRRRWLLMAGSGALTLRRPAAAASAPNEGELAYANFAVAAEYLQQDFYARALAARLVRSGTRRRLARAAVNEGEHATAFANIVTGGGQAAPRSADFEFVWPKRTFGLLEAAAQAGLRIEAAVLGAYLTAAGSLSLPSYRTLFASVAACEAEHVAILAGPTSAPSGDSFPASFPVALNLEAASDALDSHFA
jgi:Ferritin-like domain